MQPRFTIEVIIAIHNTVNKEITKLSSPLFTISTKTVISTRHFKAKSTRDVDVSRFFLNRQCIRICVWIEVIHFFTFIILLTILLCGIFIQSDLHHLPLEFRPYLKTAPCIDIWLACGLIEG